MPVPEPHAAATFLAYHNALKSIGAKLTSVQPDSLDKTFRAMQKRMLEGVSSLDLLEHQSVHDHSRDSATILRVIYDLHIQFLYVLKDPVKHSVSYWRYGCIEKYEQLILFEKHWQKIAVALPATPDWSQKRAAIVEAYDLYKPEFLTKKGRGVRKHWYSVSGV